MNRPAVMRLCGPPVEQRRISDADRIRSISKATGRYPYVVFAFRGHGGVVCIPDANYYAADGLYDVHTVDCPGPDGAVCAELAKYIADLFRMPKPPKEALLRLADEQSLCERNVLPSSACAAVTEPKKEEKKEEEAEYAPPQTPAAPPAERISASTREFLKLLYEMDQYDKSGKVVPAAPQPPSPPPDLKTLLKEQGFGWLVPAVEDASAASAVRFVLENEDLGKALQNSDMRKVILEVAKSGGAAPASPIDEALAKWPARHREVLQKMLSKSTDLNSLMSALLQYFFNNEHCTLDSVQVILDASRRMGLDCKAAAKAASW
jgi:hypothetical protein